MRNELLIVGAGPTGLAAAVELARRGIVPRVIDKKPKASKLSRAVGINSRTLHLLESSGVTNDLLNKGVKIREGQFHVKSKPAFSLNLGLAPKPYDFLLALPQDETEKALNKRFESLGGKVEFGVEFLDLNSADGSVSVDLRHLENGRKETLVCSYVLGADGIKSRVREAAGIAYSGVELPDEWSILDFDSKSWPYRETLCLFVYEKGRVCLTVPIGKSRYRGVTDRPNARGRMPAGLEIDNVRREGNFVVWVKQADKYQNGRVFIAGDAAHSHSPVGGRGMNLGIADACCFARMYAEENTDLYTLERHAAAKNTIKLTERGRRFMTSDVPGKLLLMNYIFPFLLRFRFVQRRIVDLALDTPV